jgi:hypothetical protein
VVRTALGWGYFSNDYQLVTAADAAALAEALATALDDIPDAAQTRHEWRRATDPVGGALSAAVGGAVETYGPDPDASPLAWFSGAEPKQELRDVVAFCRAGEFHLG